MSLIYAITGGQKDEVAMMSKADEINKSKEHRKVADAMNKADAMGKVDCAIIGGGPAGLQAALVLGRARRSVALIDDNRPRNAVTRASHGFLTRDGVKPAEFRRIAYEEVLRYPSVAHERWQALEIKGEDGAFTITGEGGERVEARKVIISAGLKETFPDIPGLREVYGTSMFNCPFCDGWELRDQPLIVVTGQEGAFHMTQTIFGWSKDLVVCTNGRTESFTADEKAWLDKRNIPVVEQAVSAFYHQDGVLREVAFADGTAVTRSGGFIAPAWTPKAGFHESMQYERNALGGIVAGEFGKSSVPGLFAAGDAAYVMPSQLIYAAADGGKAAVGVFRELLLEDFA